MVAGAGRSPVPGAGVQPPLGLGPQRLETPSRRRRGLGNRRSGVQGTHASLQASGRTAPGQALVPQLVSGEPPHRHIGDPLLPPAGRWEEELSSGKEGLAKGRPGSCQMHQNIDTD
ncbi:unnamed protein product [Rangifer tarandus platyrhynchus]|uniref:Uncharacterized protein n=1 Tax=Rangifer tarandus platyrhynchus TaxID=3082113 RepID=A0AC59YDD2_RANTA